MSATISNRADLDSPLYPLVETYLVGDRNFPTAQATRYCHDEGTSDCLVRVEGVTPTSRGAASTLILYFVTTGEDLPGSANLDGVEANGWGVDPAIFAATESVGHDDVIRKYDFDCRYEEGEIEIDQQLEVSGTLSGHFDLVMSCREQLEPGQSGEIGITGSFSTELNDGLYPW